jgi:molybdate transport system substrate-binding protein
VSLKNVSAWWILAAALIALAPAPAGVAPTQAVRLLRIAAASDLQAVLPRLVERFERQSGLAVRVTFGSSGNFHTQILNGAPFDLFFSADTEYPRRLLAAGLAAAADVQPYAIGRLVLWARKDAGIDVRRGLQVLADPRVRRIAIANPDHAPYGRAAVAALTHERLYDQVRSKLVLGENISQAAQFVESGNAQAGVIALSLAVAAPLRESGTYYEIPASFHPPLEQAAVALSHAPGVTAARQFVAFLKRPESVHLLQEFGFTLPSSVTPR